MSATGRRSFLASLLALPFVGRIIGSLEARGFKQIPYPNGFHPGQFRFFRSSLTQPTKINCGRITLTHPGPR